MGSDGFDDVENQVTAVAGGGDVQKCQLVGALVVVPRSNFHRIACVAQFDKIDPFDHAATRDVETGNDAFGKQ